MYYLQPTLQLCLFLLLSGALSLQVVWRLSHFSPLQAKQKKKEGEKKNKKGEEKEIM